MISSNELRIGNYISDIHSESGIWPVKRLYLRKCVYGHLDFKSPYKNLRPIPLTGDILARCGFTQLPHFTVQNLWNIQLGRGRVMSIGSVGTPNEIVFINEEDAPEVKNIIVARNYDFDGKTYLHQIQNLYFALTQKELNYDYDIYFKQEENKDKPHFTIK